MPVEIRELVIRAVVNDDQARTTTADGKPADEQAFEAIVEECVRQVLKILKNSGER